LLILCPEPTTICRGTRLVDVRRSIRPYVGADYTAAGADHPGAERAHGYVVGQPIGCRVKAAAGRAIDEQVAPAVAADVTEGYRFKALSAMSTGRHWSIMGRQAGECQRLCRHRMMSRSSSSRRMRKPARPVRRVEGHARSLACSPGLLARFAWGVVSARFIEHREAMCSPRAARGPELFI
jgi:hypothetical protein